MERPNSDRRHAFRSPCRHLSVLVGEGRVVAVEIRNISEEGVGLVSVEPLPPRATLQLTRPGFSFGCEIERVHTRQDGEDVYTGARFVQQEECVQDYVRQAALRAN